MLLGSLPRVVGFRISSDRDDRMGAKIKPPQEIPSASNKTPQNP